MLEVLKSRVEKWSRLSVSSYYLRCAVAVNLLDLFSISCPRNMEINRHILGSLGEQVTSLLHTALDFLQPHNHDMPQMQLRVQRNEPEYVFLFKVNLVEACPGFSRFSSGKHVKKRNRRVTLVSGKGKNSWTSFFLARNMKSHLEYSEIFRIWSVSALRIWQSRKSTFSVNFPERHQHDSAHRSQLPCSGPLPHPEQLRGSPEG